MNEKTIKRPVRQVGTGTPEAPAAKRPRLVEHDGVRFNEPDAHELMFDSMRLDEYLRTVDEHMALTVAEVLEGLDWDPFHRRYRPGGRPPGSPRLMLGLILYGVAQGVDSLRQLERLARKDLGAVWVSAGVQPDHSTLGRFVRDHAETLTEGFFGELTAEVLRRTGSGVSVVSGDGTTVEAAASRYRLLKQQAAKRAADEAREAAERAPDDAVLAARAEQAERVERTVDERVAARRAQGKDPENVRVSPSEPEAVVQQLKDKRVAPSYKPSVLVNEQRVVVGMDVHASNEVVQMARMFAQAGRHGPIWEAMFDAGYCAHQAIELTLSLGISFLCPEGKSQGDGDWNKKSDKSIPKSAFRYDAAEDVYVCPNGEILRPVKRYKGNDNNPAYVLYAAAAAAAAATAGVTVATATATGTVTGGCAGCPLRTLCSKSAKGRQIKRYEGDDLKDALREVMSHPNAQAHYRKRLGMVEPVFSELRLRQGLRRFRRRGLEAVRLEFALHVMAFNLTRVLARAKTFFQRFFISYMIYNLLSILASSALNLFRPLSTNSIHILLTAT